MNFKRKSIGMRLLTGALTLCVMFGAAYVGVYPAAANQTASRPPVSGKKHPAQVGTGTHSGMYSLMAERYYEAGTLPLFQMVFLRLDEEAQSKWLNRIYADQNIMFMGAAVTVLDDDCASILNLAETVYEDGDIAFFSNLAAHMSEETLEAWLDRAIEDGSWGFQSVLFNALDLGGEFDARREKQEKEWEAIQKAEYRAVGITMDGKNYYYQGKLVNIFLDIRPNKSFYTLDMNPKGTVNVKVIRNEEDEITSAAYMTDAEVMELLGDLYGDEDGSSVEIIPVDLKTVAAGETIFLGEYTLSYGDEIWYDILAETGDRMQVFFAKDEQKSPVYWSVNNLRQTGEPLECASDFTVRPPAKPGTYRLYLRAPDGALGNVKGSISILFTGES